MTASLYIQESLPKAHRNESVAETCVKQIFLTPEIEKSEFLTHNFRFVLQVRVRFGESTLLRHQVWQFKSRFI